MTSCVSPSYGSSSETEDVYGNSTENTPTDSIPISSESKVETEIMGDESPYAFGWKRMCAVIVKWGTVNDKTFIDSQLGEYDREWTDIEYIGVNVDFVKIFFNTMQDGFDTLFTIDKATCLLIPEYYLPQINEGDKSLVFLYCFGHTYERSTDGTDEKKL